MNCYTTTIDGTNKTRSGNIYADEAKAINQTRAMNKKATDMGIKISYQVTVAEENWCIYKEKVIV